MIKQVLFNKSLKIEKNGKVNWLKHQFFKRIFYLISKFSPELVDYKIKKRKPKMQLQIITDFANIYVTGTHFKVIDEPSLKRIELYEGELKIKISTGKEIVYQEGPCVSHRYDTKKIITLLAGESLTFRDKQILKGCHLEEHPNLALEESIVIKYIPLKERHRCAAHTKQYSGKNKSIKALEDSCKLIIQSPYEGCDLISQSNIEKSSLKKRKKTFEYYLTPYEIDKEAHSQYRCYF